eukprot:364919-Chlamydomonas_euryale.AAC.10
MCVGGQLSETVEIGQQTIEGCLSGEVSATATVTVAARETRCHGVGEGGIPCHGVGGGGIQSHGVGVGNPVPWCWQAAGNASHPCPDLQTLVFLPRPAECSSLPTAFFLLSRVLFRLELECSSVFSRLRLQ